MRHQSSASYCIPPSASDIPAATHFLREPRALPIPTLSVIPSGVDQTFTTGNARPLFGTSGTTSQVINKCLAETDCKAAYAARLWQALDVFEAAGYAARAIAIRDRITADVEADPRKEFTHATFLSNVTSTVSFIDGRPATIRAALVEAGFPDPTP